jgi:hypothetical protein
VVHVRFHAATDGTLTAVASLPAVGDVEMRDIPSTDDARIAAGVLFTKLEEVWDKRIPAGSTWTFPLERCTLSLRVEEPGWFARMFGGVPIKVSEAHPGPPLAALHMIGETPSHV